MKQFSEIQERKYIKWFAFKGYVYKVKPRFEKITGFASTITFQELWDSVKSDTAFIVIIRNSHYVTVTIGLGQDIPDVFVAF